MTVKGGSSFKGDEIMSYEKVIGFGVDPDKPKGELRDLTDTERGYFKRMGVEPVFIDPKAWMPEGNREPEPKIFFPGINGFHRARELISESRNAFLIPGQAYRDKHPLTSLLIDTNPTATLDPKNFSLRYRFEIDPKTGLLDRADFNEKSGMATSNIIGGCIDRYERELSQRPGEAPKEAYQAFIAKYRRHNDPAFCDGVAFENLRVGAGYQCARNEVGVAFVHPRDPVMFVLEVCEDIWDDKTPDIEHSVNKYYEFEFELKQTWGRLPSRIRTPEGFKEYAYSAMTMFQHHIHLNVPGSTINMRSKAEIAKENFRTMYGLSDDVLTAMGVRSVFDAATMYGGAKTLERVMVDAQPAMLRMGNRLFDEMVRFNDSIAQPTAADIGHGNRWIQEISGRTSPGAPVAAYR